MIPYWFEYLVILEVIILGAFAVVYVGDLVTSHENRRNLEGEEYACRAMGGFDAYNGDEHRYCAKTYTDRNLTSLLFEYQVVG